MNSFPEAQKLIEDIQIEAGSFVLYRADLARIVEIQVEKKHVKVLLEKKDKGRISVRLKDFWLLSSASKASFAEIEAPLPLDELSDAWTLLSEQESCKLADMAELIFGSTSPQALYNSFLLLNTTPYFKGQVQNIVVRSPQEVEEEEQRNLRKKQEEAQWQLFYQHYKDAKYSDEDQPFIDEIIQLANGKKVNCRLFREIKIEQTPENAHQWLLQQKLWPQRHNPYLERFEMPRTAPEIDDSWLAFIDGYKEKAEESLSALSDYFSSYCKEQGIAIGSQARRDLSHLKAWAIDDPWSKDPDDAIGLDEDGSIWVHIADPASLLAINSPESMEARARGSALYLPEFNVPMLASDLVSILGLGLQAYSPALSVRLRLTVGQVSNGSLAPTVELLDICSSWVAVQRLSYDQVDQLLDEGEPVFTRLKQLCLEHFELRVRNHAIQFDMYNTKIKAAETIRIESLENTPSRNLVAEAMIMAGAAIASYCQEKQLAIPYLCQEEPKQDIPPLDSYANMFAARKAISPSVTRMNPSKHSGMGLELYTRVTSPLRRYLDFLVHHQVHRSFHQDMEALTEEQMIELNAQVEIAVSHTRAVQRSSQKHWQLLYLMQEGKQREYLGIVLDRRENRALCMLPEVGMESTVFIKEPVALNTELKLNFKSAQLSKLDANFSLAKT